MNLSPIIFFACNRPEHTLKVLSALKKNKLSKKSSLIIYIDKPIKKIDMILYLKVVKIIKNTSGFKNKKIILRKKNFGLAKNFIFGLSEVFKKYDRAIILEDDILVSPYFLDYMNKALDLYKKEKTVSSIYSYFPKTREKLPDTFFLKGSWTFVWGIGIWRRSWRLFEVDGKKLLKKIDNKNLKKEFNFNNSYDWYSMLERSINKQNQSWAIKWYASTFLKNTFTLFPQYSLSKNIGMDGTGINTPQTKIWDVEPYKKKINVNQIKINESTSGYKAAKIFFNSVEPLYIKIYNNIKRKVYKLFYSK